MFDSTSISTSFCRANRPTDTRESWASHGRIPRRTASNGTWWGPSFSRWTILALSSLLAPTTNTCLCISLPTLTLSRALSLSFSLSLFQSLSVSLSLYIYIFIYCCLSLSLSFESLKFTLSLRSLALYASLWMSVALPFSFASYLSPVTCFCAAVDGNAALSNQQLNAPGHQIEGFFFL